MFADVAATGGVDRAVARNVRRAGGGDVRRVDALRVRDLAVGENEQARERVRSGDRQLDGVRVRRIDGDRLAVERCRVGRGEREVRVDGDDVRLRDDE